MSSLLATAFIWKGDKEHKYANNEINDFDGV